MKQLYTLLALALFFTATGFSLGRMSVQDVPLENLIPNAQQPNKSLSTNNNTDTTFQESHKETKLVQNTYQQPVQINEREIIKTDCVPPPYFMDASERTEIDKISTLLRELNTNESRLKTFNDMFEKNPRTPELDADSALTLNDFFRNDKSLENFIPQQVTCHSNLCKVDLPAIDKSDINELMENLSKQLGDKKLKASHVLLAEDPSQGSIQLYVSLLSSETQNTPTQRQ